MPPPPDLCTINKALSSPVSFRPELPVRSRFSLDKRFPRIAFTRLTSRGVCPTRRLLPNLYLRQNAYDQSTFTCPVALITLLKVALTAWLEQILHSDNRTLVNGALFTSASATEPCTQATLPLCVDLSLASVEAFFNLQYPGPCF